MRLHRLGIRRLSAGITSRAEIIMQYRASKGEKRLGGIFTPLKVPMRYLEMR